MQFLLSILILSFKDERAYLVKHFQFSLHILALKGNNSQ